MSAETIGKCPRPKAFDTILFGGLIAGVLDGLDAVVFYGLSFGVRPTLLFQNIAAGLLGRDRFMEAGTPTLLGVACHFSIAIGAAAVFYWASLVLPALCIGLGSTVRRSECWSTSSCITSWCRYRQCPRGQFPSRLSKSWTSCFRTPCSWVFLSL